MLPQEDAVSHVGQQTQHPGDPEADQLRLAAGAEFPGWSLAIGPLAGALLWPPLSLLLLAPQRGPREVDDTRPI